MNIQYKYFEHRDTRVSYFSVGAGKPVLFLHGAGVNILAYQEMIELLSKKYLVIAADIPSFGKSTVPKECWTLSDFGDYFDAFLDMLAINDVTVIGHSLGGGIAMAVAKKSKKVRKLIVIDSIGLGRKSIKNLAFTFFVRKTITGLFTYKQPTKIRALGKYFIQNIMNHPMQQGRVLRMMNQALMNCDTSFEQISTDTLILWGDKDEIFPVGDAEVLRKRIPHAKVEIVNGNHDWCLFDPEKFISLTSEFMGER